MILGCFIRPPSPRSQFPSSRRLSAFEFEMLEMVMPGLQGVTAQMCVRVTNPKHASDHKRHSRTCLLELRGEGWFFLRVEYPPKGQGIDPNTVTVTTHGLRRENDRRPSRQRTDKGRAGGAAPSKLARGTLDLGASFTELRVIDLERQSQATDLENGHHPRWGRRCGASRRRVAELACSRHWSRSLRRSEIVSSARASISRSKRISDSSPGGLSGSSSPGV